jgi:hypothetical protein
MEVFLGTELVHEVLANTRHRLIAAFLSTLNQHSNPALNAPHGSFSSNWSKSSEHWFMQVTNGFLEKSSWLLGLVRAWHPCGQ